MDSLARLILREVNIGAGPKSGKNLVSVGSVSVALLPGDAEDKLLISFKKNIDKNYLDGALRNIIYYAQKIHLSNNNYLAQLDELKNEIYQIDSQLKQTTNPVEVKKLLENILSTRQNIDKLKLNSWLESSHVRGSIDERLKNILFRLYYDNDSSSIQLLPNPRELHSELVIIEHFLNEPVALGYAAKGRANVPYQYIGGSILNCAKCDALIRGGKDVIGINDTYSPIDLVFLSRGHYTTGYPCYSLPAWALRQNRKISEQQISHALDRLSTPSKTYSPQDLSRLQNAELSDSDEE